MQLESQTENKGENNVSADYPMSFEPNSDDLCETSNYHIPASTGYGKSGKAEVMVSSRVTFVMKRYDDDDMSRITLSSLLGV